KVVTKSKAAPMTKKAAPTPPAKESKVLKGPKAKAPAVEAKAKSTAVAAKADKKKGKASGDGEADTTLDITQVSAGRERTVNIDKIVRQLAKAAEQNKNEVSYGDVNAALPKGKIKPEIVDEIIMALNDSGVEVSDVPGA